VVAPESEVQAAIERYYATPEEEASLAQFENIDLAGQAMTIEAEDDGSEDDDAAEVQSGPVVKLVNAILVDAIRAGASDVHIEPQEKSVQLRYRVDGMLRQVMTMPKRVQGKLISRMKIISHLDISERRKPQDGRARLGLAGKNYDLRVSTLPASDGEKVVVRILVQDRAKVSLEELGFDSQVLATLRELLKRPQGMVLVTGPTGSGKTSTLYAALNFLKHETTNIVTVEDPVEYRLAGVNQVAVSDKAGLTFAAGLRSILRQDPNVIMVGEIRDLETAQIAFQAAQTGHMVLSTLHTNDAPSAITRLVEMGIPAYLVASSVIAVLAQRLTRRLCDCRTVQPDGSARPKGCEACRFSGFRGRMAIYELMKLTPRVRSVVLARAGDDVVRSAAQATGMQTMFGDGKRKAEAGLTTVEEVLRVVPPDEEDDPEARVGAAGVEAPPPSAPVALSSEALRARRSRIVVAEDDASLRGMLTEVLASENYEVLAAENGEEALNLVYREQADLVLTDVNMPRMTGIELLKRLRGDLSTCQIPVVVLTVEGSVETEVQALGLGADDYLTKPVERGRLLGRVRRALFRSRLRVMV
jgi:type IV pilus assembly protein PilB